jgi:hypothetical protein
MLAVLLDSLKRVSKVLARERSGLCLAKTLYIHKINDLAQSSNRAFPLRFLLCFRGRGPRGKGKR